MVVVRQGLKELTASNFYFLYALEVVSPRGTNVDNHHFLPLLQNVPHKPEATINCKTAPRNNHSPASIARIVAALNDVARDIGAEKNNIGLH